MTRATPESKASDLSTRVVVADAPRRLVLTIDDPAYRATTDYRITKEATGTDIIVTSSLEAFGFMQTLRFLLGQQRLMPMLRQTARERAQSLLDLAERIAEALKPAAGRCRSASPGRKSISPASEARNTASCAMSFGSIIALIDARPRLGLHLVHRPAADLRAAG